MGREPAGAGRFAEEEAEHDFGGLLRAARGEALAVGLEVIPRPGQPVRARNFAIGPEVWPPGNPWNDVVIVVDVADAGVPIGTNRCLPHGQYLADDDPAHGKRRFVSEWLRVPRCRRVTAKDSGGEISDLQIRIA